MKKTALLFTYILFVFVFISPAQENSEWTRIESDKKEVSVSFPPDFLVNAEPVNYSKNVLIVGFYQDMKMEFSISKPREPRRIIKSAFVLDRPNLSGVTFDFNGLASKNFVSKGKRYFNTFFLASDDYLYRISVTAKTDSDMKIESKQEVARFINSIKIKGQQLIVPNTEYREPADKTVSALSLKTSSEVAEALQRKPDKTKIKITYLPESAMPKDEDDEEFERSAIILARPLAHLSREALSTPGSNKVALRLTLLANGQVGDVTVYSDASKLILHQVTALLKDTKFIPAKIAGKAVDSQQTIKYFFR